MFARERGGKYGTYSCLFILSGDFTKYVLCVYLYMYVLKPEKTEHYSYSRFLFEVNIRIKVGYKNRENMGFPSFSPAS